MSKCALCHKPVKSGIVVHSECMPRWISVERRLPPDPDESIIDYLPEYIVMVRGATESTVMHYAGNGEWIYGGDLYPVTHWMPLPPPPEVGT